MGEILLFVYFFIFVALIEAAFLSAFMKVDYKKYSLFYRYILKWFYKFDKD